MSLSDEVHSLRDRVLNDLDAAHDYYTWSKRGWNLLSSLMKEDVGYSFRNLTTGSTITGDRLRIKSREFIAKELAESTFQQFLSIFDSFFLDFLQSWLKEYPESLKRKQIDYQVVLDSPDKEAITLNVINKELIEITYKRPVEWFKYLNGLVALDCPSEEEINRLAEAKASRDLLVHNRGIVNDYYLQKAGNLARANKNERIEISPDYHRGTWALIRKIVGDVANAAINKLVKT